MVRASVTLALALLAGSTSAFAPAPARIPPAHLRPSSARVAPPLSLSSTAAPSAECECDVATGAATVGAQTVTAELLRSLALTDAADGEVRLGDAMGSGDAVVCFLRHLGWPYCWDFARDMNAQREVLAAAGVAGPVFVSVGTAEKLQKFLELNPTLPADSTFVDGARPGDDQLRAFPAYDAVGFEALPLPGGGGDDNKAKADALAEAAKALKPPSLSPGEWFKYLANVARVSPVPDGMKFGEVPTGVLRLGGTFVVRDDRVVYAYADPLPGAHPNVDEVVAKALGSAAPSSQ